MKQLARMIQAVALTVLATALYGAPLVHTTDFIPDGSRSAFNGFELIPNDGAFYTGGSGPYVEDGIVVEQINGDSGNDIWVIGVVGEGTKAWYPNGGDNGYTRVTRSGGLDFQDVGLLRSTGFFSGSGMMYELWNDGSLILGGGAANTYGTWLYLGFSGGGFDEIRMRNGGSDGSVSDGRYQALAIDSIELGGSAVPDFGSTLMLLSVAQAGLIAFRRRGES